MRRADSERNDCVAFAHCEHCISDKPSGVSPAQWARLAVGFTADGNVLVWCERHDCMVVRVALEKVDD